MLKPVRRDDDGLPLDFIKMGLGQPEAEKELLALMLDTAILPTHLSEYLLEQVSSQLQPDDFYHVFYGRVYKTILDLAGQGFIPEPTLLISRMRKQPNYSDEDMQEILGLVSNVYDPVHGRRAETLIELIVEASKRRHVMGVFSEYTRRALDHGESVDDLALAAEQALARARQQRIGADNTIAAIAKEYRAQLAEWRATPFKLRGVSTGLKQLDTMTNGIKRGNLWIIGSRMSMGKTSFALTLALQAARDEHGQVGFVSLEMSDLDLFQRLVSMASTVAAASIEAGDPAADWDRVEGELAVLEEMPIRIIDSTKATNRLNGSRGKMTPEEIRRHVLAWHRQQPLSILFIDYLEIVKPPAGAEKQSRDIQLGLIAQAFKDLATELNIPVVLLAQTNREGERSGTKVPTLASLRYSDEIGAVADVVIFPVRWDYYRERGEQVPEEAANRPRGITDLVIAKQRNGKVGTVPIFFAGHLMRFFDWSDEKGCPVNYKGAPLRGLLPPPEKKEGK